MAKGRKTGGRKAGTPNKVSGQVKETMAHVVASTEEDTLKWLRGVADGAKEFSPELDDDGEPVLDDDGKPKGTWDWLRRPEPGTALKLWMEMSEFLQPKLARTEHVDPNGKALPVLQVQFVRAKGGGGN